MLQTENNIYVYICIIITKITNPSSVKLIKNRTKKKNKKGRKKRTKSKYFIPSS